METELGAREEAFVKIRGRHEVSDCVQAHKTSFGRWALTYEVALRDVLLNRDQIQQNRDELRVLMLGCSLGMVALDFLSLFDKAVAEIGLRTKCKILALDICEGVVGIAQNGLHQLRRGMDRRVDEIHGGVPWIFLDEKRLMVKWEALAASGHALEYRAFDIDQGLSALGEAPFDLVEINNCHNKDCKGEVANVQSVTQDRSLVLCSSYTDRQEVLFYQQFGEILREVNDPEVLRFMSGLSKAHGVETAFREQSCRDSLRALLKLAGACVKPWNGSIEEKKEFLSNSPLLQFLGRIAGLDGVATWFQSDAIELFMKDADPVLREALDGMYRFAFDSLHSDDGAEFCSLDRQAFYTRS